MRPRILCAMPEETFRRMFTPELERELEQMGDVTRCANARELTEERYAALWRATDYAVTGWGVRPPTEEMLASAVSLKAIAHTAGTVRAFPRAAIERGVVITSARAAIARTVGEFCLMAAITLLRRLTLPQGFGKVRNETLFDKTVGLVGYGCVGREFRELLRPFGCRVLVYDPYLPEDVAVREGVELTGLHELLRASRVVSLHAPDVPETRGMIGAAEVAALQDGSVLVNAARGRLVDTAALTEALADGKLFAAIDVTDPEPLPQDHPLRTMSNVLFTPHVAGPTEDDLPRLTRMALDDLAALIREDKPRYPISLEAYDRMSF